MKARGKAPAAQKERRLREIIRERVAKAGGGGVFIGFSGGVDSSLLLWETVRTLGPENHCRDSDISYVYSGRRGIGQKIRIGFARKTSCGSHE